jgi:surface protein
MYTVTIQGLIVGWRFRIGESHSDVDRSGGCRNNLLTITQWGCLQLGNRGAYFKGCKRVRCAARDALDLKETTNLESMFFGTSSFTSDLSAWQTGQVTNMSRMFAFASSFTSDLSAWQTGQVTDMCRMFFGASSFTSDLSAWQTVWASYRYEWHVLLRVLLHERFIRVADWAGYQHE